MPDTDLKPTTLLRPVRGPIGDIAELDFPPPYCPYDLTDLEHDGDGWQCEKCGADWNDRGTRGTRRCLECKDEPATVIDVDGRPLCAGCAKHMDSERAAEAADDDV